jgi:hypothetical protein
MILVQSNMRAAGMSTVAVAVAIACTLGAKLPWAGQAPAKMILADLMSHADTIGDC